MGFLFGLIKRLFKLVLCFAIFAAVIVFIPNLPPYSTFSSIEIEPSQSRVGPLAPNGDLNNAEKLYKDKLLGPEAFQLYNGEVYTGLATGEMVKISPGGHVTFVTQIGQPCSGLTQTHICGRPLGFEIDEKTKQMYIADAYYGIWKVDLKTDKKQLLVSPRTEIEGRQTKIFNSLALAKNGDFYWTDSSSEFLLKDGAFSSLTDPSGRLFYYNAARNQSKVLLDKLWFPNGVAISPDNQFVVVSETMRFRLMKYYIDGPKRGKSEVFVAGLPGTPDNVRALPDGSGMLVALYSSFDNDHPLIMKSLSQTPLVRKFIVRLMRLIEIPFEFLNNQYPNVIFDEIVYHIGHFQSVSGFLPGLSGLVQLDWNGNIVASYYNTDGSQKAISDAIVYNDKLYMGSPNEQNFIASVPAPPLLKKAFASVISAPPKIVEKVTVEVPQPKTESKPQQTKPSESSKQNRQEKPKVDEKKETLKVPKPVVQEPPKPKEQPKPAEPAKPTPKPAKETRPNVETKAPPTVKPTQQPPKQSESKPESSKPDVKPPKPEVKTPPAKPNEPKTPPPKNEPKVTSPKTEQKPIPEKPAAVKREVPKTNKASETKPQQKPIPEHIPIKEEIPSDTVKPNKETLKVIKKGGPTEIPNPNL